MKTMSRQKKNWNRASALADVEFLVEISFFFFITRGVIGSTIVIENVSTPTKLISADSPPSPTLRKKKLYCIS